MVVSCLFVFVFCRLVCVCCNCWLRLGVLIDVSN